MASGTQELESFVREALTRGCTRDDIERTMLAAGWTTEQARSALGAYAIVDFPVPVPRPRPYLSAREAFLYLVLFSTLYLSAYNLGSLIFDFINRAFPDPTVRSPYYAGSVEDSIRWSVSSLIIAFPAFLLISRYIGRELVRNPVKRLSTIRRWLTYLTLFIAAGIMIGDLITLVYNLLGGELTVRFVLKVVTAAVIAGTVFGYYLWDLRREERE